MIEWIVHENVKKGFPNIKQAHMSACKFDFSDENKLIFVAITNQKKLFIILLILSTPPHN